MKNIINTIKLLLSDWGFTFGGILDNRKGEWYLIAQLILIFAHLLPSFPRTNISIDILNYSYHIIGVLFVIYGVYLSIVSFLELGSNLSPLPDPKENAKFFNRYSYKNCRHPLYKGLLIFSMGTVIFKLSLIHLIIFILLSFVLKSKAIREESKLKIKYKEYDLYIKETPAIARGIYFFDWRS